MSIILTLIAAMGVFLGGLFMGLFIAALLAVAKGEDHENPSR